MLKEVLSTADARATAMAVERATASTTDPHELRGCVVAAKTVMEDAFIGTLHLHTQRAVCLVAHDGA